ncbi:MAG TPA: M48 family metallopeptidase [Ktedonosporobacter sp.]|jgi:STE24 endopeptidase|nr:M48 family metallopeptidase [Ktedonosporobacter sp.]
MEIEVERQQQAREYARIQRRLSLLEIAIVVAGLAIVFSAGLDKWLRDLLQGLAQSLAPLNWQPLAGWFPLQLLLYFLIITCVLTIVFIPLAYYAGFLLPRRYGISVMTFKAWVVNRLKGATIGFIFQAVLISLIYALLALQPRWWWLWTGIILLFFSVVMANLAPILFFPLFYKFTPLPEGELKQRLMELAARARTSVRGVYVMRMSDKTTSANAALMGLGNTRRIVIGDTMIDRYTPDEIEVVLAHELGHHLHSDIWKLIISQSVLTFGGLYIAHLALQWVVDTQHVYRSLTDPATLPFLFVLVAFYGLIITPLGNMYSRRLEYQADEYALQSTRKVEAFQSAMARLANQNLTVVEPSPIIEFLFHSHPSVSKRIKHADDFAAGSAHALSASLNADNRSATTSTDPSGMFSSGSSTPDSAH